MKVRFCPKCGCIFLNDEKYCKYDSSKLKKKMVDDILHNVGRCPDCERLFELVEVRCKHDTNILSASIICCAKCGNINIREHLMCCSCFGCDNYDASLIYASARPKSYYESQSEKFYDTKDRWESLFVEEELSKNPYFDRSRYQQRIEKERAGAENLRKYEERQAKLKQLEQEYPELARASEPQPNTPHCPTCGSTNLRKIGNLERGLSVTVWGFGSSKMGKQFECKDCGYKF